MTTFEERLNENFKQLQNPEILNEIIDYFNENPDPKKIQKDKTFYRNISRVALYGLEKQISADYDYNILGICAEYCKEGIKQIENEGNDSNKKILSHMHTWTSKYLSEKAIQDENNAITHLNEALHHITKATELAVQNQDKTTLNIYYEKSKIEYNLSKMQFNYSMFEIGINTLIEITKLEGANAAAVYFEIASRKYELSKQIQGERKIELLESAHQNYEKSINHTDEKWAIIQNLKYKINIAFDLERITNEKTKWLTSQLQDRTRLMEHLEEKEKIINNRKKIIKIIQKNKKTIDKNIIEETYDYFDEISIQSSNDKKKDILHGKTRIAEILAYMTKDPIWIERQIEDQKIRIALETDPKINELNRKILGSMTNCYLYHFNNTSDNEPDRQKEQSEQNIEENKLIRLQKEIEYKIKIFTASPQNQIKYLIKDFKKSLKENGEMTQILITKYDKIEQDLQKLPQEQKINQYETKISIARIISEIENDPNWKLKEIEDIGKLISILNDEDKKAKNYTNITKICLGLVKYDSDYYENAIIAGEEAIKIYKKIKPKEFDEIYDINRHLLMKLYYEKYEKKYAGKIIEYSKITLEHLENHPNKNERKIKFLKKDIRAIRLNRKKARKTPLIKNRKKENRKNDNYLLEN